MMFVVQCKPKSILFASFIVLNFFLSSSQVYGMDPDGQSEELYRLGVKHQKNYEDKIVQQQVFVVQHLLEFGLPLLNSNNTIEDIKAIQERSQNCDRSQYVKNLDTKEDQKSAIENFTLAADKGHLKSQKHLASIYANHKLGVENNPQLVIHYYKLAAEQGDVESQYELGSIFQNGKLDTPKDLQTALEYYRRATAQYDQLQLNAKKIHADFRLSPMTDAQYDQLGDACMSKKALFHMKQILADMGDAEAQYKFAKECTEIDTRDEKKAIHYYTLAADQGHKDAQFWFGYIYETDSYNYGFKKNPELSLSYYTLAADQGHIGSQYKLGSVYKKGELGVSVDPQLAIRYLALAADQGHLMAQKDLANIYLKGELGFSVDPQLAIRYLTLAADQRDKKAQDDLGSIYLEGKLVPENPELAIRYNLLIAKHYDEQQQDNMVHSYYNKLLSKYDFDAVFKTLKDSADQENANARDLYKLAEIYEKYGKHCGASFPYYKRSADLGNKGAQFRLSSIYEEGLFGIPKNPELAKHSRTLAMQRPPRRQG